MNLRQPDVVTIAVSRVDGGVTILRVITREYMPDPLRPGERVIHKEYDPTPAYIESLIAKYVNDGHWIGGLTPTGWELVPNDYLNEQTDKTFRDAWKHTPGKHKPDTDMPKAREIHKEKLRVMRLPLFEALDLEYFRADEEGDQQKKRVVALKKQALREVTNDPGIEAAQTPDELKAVIPLVLNG